MDAVTKLLCKPATKEEWERAHPLVETGAEDIERRQAFLDNWESRQFDYYIYTDAHAAGLAGPISFLSVIEYELKRHLGDKLRQSDGKVLLRNDFSLTYEAQARR